MRALKANEVEARVGTVSKSGSGLSLLLYKDARADMTILDETVGPFNWQRVHEFKDGKLYCRVGIWDPEKGWVWKEDVGSPSNMEADKGQASDSFKRACTNWGIGRELYTAPFIWVPKENCNLEQFNGKWTCRDRFEVTRLKSAYGKIIEVRISSQKGIVYSWVDPHCRFSRISELTEGLIAKGHERKAIGQAISEQFDKPMKDFTEEEIDECERLLENYG